MFATGRRRRRLTPSTPRSTPRTRPPSAPGSAPPSTPPSRRTSSTTSRRTATAVWPARGDAFVRHVLLGGVILAACGTFLAGCATGTAHRASTHQLSVADTHTSPHHTEKSPPHRKETPAAAVHPTTAPPGVNTSYPLSTYAEQETVLSTWVAAEQQVYAYMDEPPAPLRADLIAGESGGELFPKLSEYYTGAALSSGIENLMNMKLSLLNGPTTYNLGHPVVLSLKATTAQVASCISDSGTTTSSGQPGPLTLDGGPGGAKGVSDLIYMDGSWLIEGGHSSGVTKC